MHPALTIALLWLLFGSVHMILSATRVRPRVVAAVGEQAFQGIYSLIALAIFVPLVWAYFAGKHVGPWLWEPIGRGPVGVWLIYVPMGIAFTMLVAGLVKPSPASVAPGAATASGIHLITRHPVIMAFGLFGLAHLLPNAAASDLVFFAGFAVFALIGCRHQDLRKLQTGPRGFAEFYAQTPFVPFTGSRTLQGLREIPLWVYAIGLALTVGIRYWHPF